MPGVFVPGPGEPAETGAGRFVPLKKNMAAYDGAVRLAQAEDTAWQKHPKKQRKNQQIAFVPGMGESGRPEEALPAA
jgi:hypothetical protein